MAQGFQVCLLRMHAALRYQPHEMKPSTCFFSPIKSRLQHRLIGKRACFDCTVDAQQVLVDNAACPDVHVAHFAVTHLAVGQSDVLSVRPQGGLGVLCQQSVHVWSVGRGNCVARVIVSDAPTIQDD